MAGSYHCLVENINGTADVYLSHNGYGGFNSVRNFTTKTNSAAATVSRQGIADLNKVIARGYTIENIDIVVPDNTPDMYNALIYIQTDYSDIKIDGVRVTFVNHTVDPVGTNPSHLIRFNGNNKGDVIINNVEANTIGTAIRLDKRSSYDNKNSVVRIDNVRAEKAGTLVNSRGIQNLE